MPSFLNPFSGNVPRKMTKLELMQALRIDFASELEAIYAYESHAAATDDPVAKKVLLDIAKEEQEHCGELLALMKYFDPGLTDDLLAGQEEVREMMREVGVSTETAPKIDATVGSLMETEVE